METETGRQVRLITLRHFVVHSSPISSSSFPSALHPRPTSKMPSLLYCVLARGSTVLARYADCAGNFSEVTDVVLARVDPAENQKMSYR